MGAINNSRFQTDPATWTIRDENGKVTYDGLKIALKQKEDEAKAKKKYATGKHRNDDGVWGITITDPKTGKVVYDGTREELKRPNGGAETITEAARPIKNEGAERFRVKGSDLILEDENGKIIYAGPEKKPKRKNK